MYGELELAWSLADTASQYLDPDQRNKMFVAIGVGETLTAIRLALEAITCARCRVGDRVAAHLSAWLDAYAGHDDEPCLRRFSRQVSDWCGDRTKVHRTAME